MFLGVIIVTTDIFIKQVRFWGGKKMISAWTWEGFPTYRRVVRRKINPHTQQFFTRTVYAAEASFGRSIRFTITTGSGNFRGWREKGTGKPETEKGTYAGKCNLKDLLDSSYSQTLTSYSLSKNEISKILVCSRIDIY